MTQAPQTASGDSLDALATTGPRGRGKPSLALCVLLCAAANATAAVLLLLFGRPLLPQQETLRLWSTGFGAASNSQHLTDPYSFMHAVFGAGLCLFLDRLKPDWPVRSKLAVAVLGSVLWEIVENTPMVIDLFNASNQPGAYSGDTILNALSDTGFVMLGFLAARFVGWRGTLLLALLVEVALSATIGDGFVLGILAVFGLF
ncbi:hypothetical protein Sa4125_36390 [Aureimonas sp. SA4125]|uniref:DUF2585 family protein n=1 Tax=Aureimonas sp. SA4125 TaxID=2826993 RepID=UPI001CC4539F|nr:DUF2585 family protein [Aureimonas sp. SA4125]BDA86097.1 hypothetical protein Sa4125_36390 [Aureimonas sp. SA4125]